MVGFVTFHLEIIIFDLVFIYVAKKILDDICKNQRDSLHKVSKRKHYQNSTNYSLASSEFRYPYLL